MRSSLERIAHRLTPQTEAARTTSRRLPPRSRHWQSTYDLAVDVIHGLGLTYLSGYALAPGYVVDTWRIWEDLLTLALRAAFTGNAVLAQRPFSLGQSTKVHEHTSMRQMFVKPDLLITLSDGSFLVDAKYKGRSNSQLVGISNSDTYEALAFLTASGHDVIVLCYPHVDRGGDRWALGDTRVIEEQTIGAKRVLAVETEVCGIARPGGMRAFSTNLAAGVLGATASREN